jgi:hypothetical protein
MLNRSAQMLLLSPIHANVEQKACRDYCYLMIIHTGNEDHPGEESPQMLI